MTQCICCNREIKSHEIKLKRLDAVEFASIHEGCLDRWGGHVHRNGEWKRMDEEAVFTVYDPSKTTAMDIVDSWIAEHKKRMLAEKKKQEVEAKEE